LTISTAGIRATGAARISAILPTGWAQREVTSQTAIRTKQSLNISEGCTDSGPMRSQRRAPDTVRPSAKTATSATRPPR
jgi:hypothetical protein